jgi:hypothetical protein
MQLNNFNSLTELNKMIISKSQRKSGHIGHMAAIKMLRELREENDVM